MKITVSLLLSAAFLTMTAAGQGLSVRLVTSLYGWERQDTVGSSTNHLRGYENLQLSFGTADVSVHTSMQGSTDLSEPMANDPQLRLFNAYVHLKNVARLFDVKLGRQVVFAGVNYGSFDGALVRVRPADGVEVTAYGGGLTPPSQRPDFFQDVENNWQAGGQVLLYLVDNTKIGLSYMNRHRATTPFDSYRYDPQNGLLPSRIDYGSRANQYGSVDAAWMHDKLWLFGRCDYDFNFERLSRAELAATYKILPRLGLSLNLARREPTIAYNSYFALLEAEANNEAMLGVDYEVHPLATLQARVSTVMYDDETAVRFSLGCANKYASVMYTKDASYDGDLDGFNLQFAYPFLDGMLTPHLGAVYSTYTLADDLDKTSTWAGVIGAMYRPLSMLTFDAQAQYLTNKIYKSDMRALVRVQYQIAHAFGQER